MPRTGVVSQSARQLQGCSGVGSTEPSQPQSRLPALLSASAHASVRGAGPRHLCLPNLPRDCSHDPRRLPPAPDAT